MSYQGPYDGQYATVPGYAQPQQQAPRYYANEMQYPVQQQMPPSQRQMYQYPSDSGILQQQNYMHTLRYFQSQGHPQAQLPPQYSSSNPPYQQSQCMENQYSQSHYTNAQYSPYMDSQPLPAEQKPSPMPAPRPHMQTNPYPQQQFQSQSSSIRVPSEWSQQQYRASQPPKRAPLVPHDVNDVNRRPSGVAQRPTVQQSHPREPVAVTPRSVDSNIRSSPDPLAPTPDARQARPQQVTRQLPPIQTPISAKPKADLTPSSRTPQIRVASHVEIPVMARTQKRRRSNEGKPIPVCDSPNVDYQAALLALADEYINAAYSLKTLDTDKQIEEYHELVAMAMGCLDSALKNFRHASARKEARIRLRLASLMIEETENSEEAEEILGKGIALCDQNRLTDVKYAMHHLSARLMYKHSPRATLKATDKLVQEVEKLRLVHWAYAFRFLRVCLGMQSDGHSDTAATLKNLGAIAAMADEHRHIAMQITAATIEAMVHLRSDAADAVEMAQRAMASARTHQLGDEMQKMPQIRILLDCLDLSCSFVSGDPNLIVAKLNQMHQTMDPATHQSGWSKDGTISIEMAQSTNEDVELDTCGLMKNKSNQMSALNLRWTNQNDIYVIGYLLSGIAHLYKGHKGKAEPYLQEGLKLNKAMVLDRPQSLKDRTTLTEQQQALDTTARLLIIFEYCGRLNWKLASQCISQARNEFAARAIEIDEETTRILLYLDAMCRQARGEFEDALMLYQSPLLTFEPNTKVSNAEKDIRVLATLNSIMTLRALDDGAQVKAEPLQEAVEDYCRSHRNKAFSAAYFMTKATVVDSQSSIIKTKQFLQFAVQASRAAANDQLLFVVMNAMTDLFFHGIIGDQAEKSATAARTLAKKSGSRLWLCVADAMFGEVKHRCGKTAEAEAALREGYRLWTDLPEALQQTLALPVANDSEQAG